MTTKSTLSSSKLEYKIIQRKSAKNLSEVINEVIADGWEVAGGLAVFTDPASGGVIFSQAVIKKDL